MGPEHGQGQSHPIWETRFINYLYMPDKAMLPHEGNDDDDFKMKNKQVHTELVQVLDEWSFVTDHHN